MMCESVYIFTTSSSLDRHPFIETTFLYIYIYGLYCVCHSTFFSVEAKGQHSYDSYDIIPICRWFGCGKVSRATIHSFMRSNASHTHTFVMIEGGTCATCRRRRRMGGGRSIADQMGSDARPIHPFKSGTYSKTMKYCVSPNTTLMASSSS